MQNSFLWSSIGFFVESHSLHAWSWGFGSVRPHYISSTPVHRPFGHCLGASSSTVHRPTLSLSTLVLCFIFCVLFYVLCFVLFFVICFMFCVLCFVLCFVLCTLFCFYIYIYVCVGQIDRPQHTFPLRFSWMHTTVCVSAVLKLFNHSWHHEDNGFYNRAYCLCQRQGCLAPHR